MGILQSKQKIDDRLNRERLDRCVPVAHKVLDILVGAKAHIGDMTPEQAVKHYTPISESVVECFIEHKVHFSEVNFIFQLLRQPIEGVSSQVQESLKRSFEKAENKLFKKDYMELTLEDIDTILKS